MPLTYHVGLPLVEWTALLVFPDRIRAFYGMFRNDRFYKLTLFNKSPHNKEYGFAIYL